MANIAKPITSVESAIDLLRSQGFEVNVVNGIYRVRKEGWEKRPYELSAETLIRQAETVRVRALAEDTFSRIERSNAVRNAHARKLGE